MVLDVSNIIYGGHRGKDYRVKGFPIGGIRKLVGIINSSIGRQGIVLAFDSGNLMKKELLPTYKAGRVPDYSVWAQLDFLEEMCKNCNIPYYKKDRFEADDIIASVCEILQDIRYPEEVTVYSDDRDISCCVSSTVSIKNVTSQGICLDKANFESRVVAGITIPFNTILCHKVIHGDRSDAYGGLRVSGLSFEALSGKYVQSFSEAIDNGQLSEAVFYNFDAYAMVLDEFHLSEAEHKLAYDQGRIVYPYRVDLLSDTDAFLSEYYTSNQKHSVIEEHLNICTATSINLPQFNAYCTALGLNKTQYGRQVDFNSVEVQSIVERFDLMARELSTGVTAVKHKNTPRAAVPTAAIASMSLPL